MHPDLCYQKLSLSVTQRFFLGGIKTGPVFTHEVQDQTDLWGEKQKASFKK